MCPPRFAVLGQALKWNGLSQDERNWEGGTKLFLFRLPPIRCFEPNAEGDNTFLFRLPPIRCFERNGEGGGWGTSAQFRAAS